MKTTWLACILITLSLSACAVQNGPVVNTPVPQSQPTSAPASEQVYLPALASGSTATAGVPTQVPTIPVAPLEVNSLQNMEFTMPVSQMKVKLSNGYYEARSGNDYLEVRITSDIAEGDLNGDGIADAALVIAENTGGTGRFASLVIVLNQNGNPVQTALYQIGDRVKINQITIKNERVTLDMVIHGPQDPLCCPSLPTTQTFRLSSAELLLDRVLTKTPEGKERAIQIDSPADGAQVGDSVQLKGSETISPFENTLAYRIFDEKDQKLAEGSFQVSAPEPGGLATFDTAIDGSKIPVGSSIWLQVLDTTAADGSTIALDSVRLVRK
jgi:hypothetical protein